MSDAPRLRTLPVILYEQTEAQWAVDQRTFSANVMGTPVDGPNAGKHKLFTGSLTYAQLPFLEDTSSLGSEKVWEGYITQSGTGDPVVVAITNTLGGNPVVTYSSEGGYIATLLNGFGTTKTSSFLGPVGVQQAVISGLILEMYPLDNDTLGISCGVIGSNVGQDGVLLDTYFKITVKP